MNPLSQCSRLAIARLALVGLSIAVLSPCSWAGTLTGPTALDTFPSKFSASFRLFPAYTGLPEEVCIGATGFDYPGTQTEVLRELNAFVGPSGTDTIDTEFVSMHQAGYVDCGPGPLLGMPLQFKVGDNNGFLPGLGPSYGQVWEDTGTPVNGELDVFPANSKFDLFIDVWVDLNVDDSVQYGEVLRNFGGPAIMENDDFSGFPPYGDSYFLQNIVDFYVVNLDGTNSGLLAARMGDCPDCGPNDVHEVLPEPSSLAIFGGLTLLGGRRQWKRWRSRNAQR